MLCQPDHLITFIAVADAGNISKAARQLHLSQPAVSTQMRTLQEWFGAPLYHRQGQGIVLTDAGRSLLAQARRVRVSLDDTQALRDAYHGLAAGELRLGASTTPASYLLPRLVAQFRQTYPAISLYLSDGNTAEIVERLPLLDLAFIEGEITATLPSDTAVTPWHRDEVLAIVPADHPLAAQAGASLRAIASYPWVAREPGSGLRRLVARTFEQAGHTPVATLELAGVEAVKHAVRAGLGVGFVSSLAMQHEAAGLVGLRIGAGLVRTFSILLPHGDSPSRATSHFLALMSPHTQAVGRASHLRANSTQ